MRNRPEVAPGPCLAALAALALSVAPLGCGDSKPDTGTQSGGPPPQIQKANDNMMDHMKAQQKK